MSMKTLHDSLRRPALEVKHLRLVQAIGAEQSVTRAAGRLHLSQSAVSHQLLDLERALGTRLFDRIGKKMMPTPAGLRMIGSADRFLGALASLEQEILHFEGDARSPLRVTTSCYTSYNWLPRVLSEFEAAHPRVAIDIVLEATRRANDALAQDEVDLAIVTRPLQGEPWRGVELVSGELTAVGSPRHPAFAGKSKSMKWSDLRGSLLLVHDIGDQDLARLHAAVGGPVDVRKIPLTEALIELARAGTGIVIADRWMVEPHFARGSIVGLPLVPRDTRTFWAVWRKSNPRRLPMEELVACVQRAANRRGKQLRSEYHRT